MVIRIEHDSDNLDGMYYDFYEGSRIIFRLKEVSWEKGVDIFIKDGRKELDVEIKEGSNVRIFLMNDQGRTIDKMSV